MAVLRYVNLSFPEAQPLADLTGVEQDLKVAESFCDLLMEELQRFGAERNKTPPNPVLWEALTVAALIRYARAFAKGVRTRSWRTIEPVVGGLPDELASNHQRFLDLRDKHIAHSVNRLEEKNQVRAYLVPEEKGARGVASISAQHDRLFSLGVEDAKHLKALCVEMRSRISGLIKAETAKVLKLARRLPVDELYAQVDPPPELPSWSDVNKRR